MHQRTSGLLARAFRLTGTPVKPWLLGMIGFGIICSTMLPANLLAQPTAKWTTQWDPVFPHLPTTKERRNGYNINIGNASYASAFGKASTINGQKKNIGAIGEPLPGTDAVAKARSFVTSRSPLLAFSEADGRVVFTRSFSLSDSPRGWDVSLDTDLNGKLFATSGASGNPTAEVIYDVAVKDAHSSRVLLESKYKDKVDTTGLTHVTGTNPDHVSTRLSDGDYTLFGEFDTFVRVEVTSSNFFGTPEQASALYFDSLTVKLDATPVPVPETTNLVGAFAVVGFGGYVWFRRRRTARCS